MRPNKNSNPCRLAYPFPHLGRSSLESGKWLSPVTCSVAPSRFIRGNRSVLTSCCFCGLTRQIVNETARFTSWLCVVIELKVAVLSAGEASIASFINLAPFSRLPSDCKQSVTSNCWRGNEQMRPNKNSNPCRFAHPFPHLGRSSLESGKWLSPVTCSVAPSRFIRGNRSVLTSCCFCGLTRQIVNETARFTSWLCVVIELKVAVLSAREASIASFTKLPLIILEESDRKQSLSRLESALALVYSQ